MRHLISFCFVSALWLACAGCGGTTSDDAPAEPEGARPPEALSPEATNAEAEAAAPGTDAPGSETKP
ncbi:MAG: hypothetical protein ACC628_07160 [Pirellulaceae bacterium]